jgi:hypothetical protein
MGDNIGIDLKEESSSDLIPNTAHLWSLMNMEMDLPVPRKEGV